jgi:hypothetical protein
MPGGLFFTLCGRFRDALFVWESSGEAMLGASGATLALVYGLLFI